MTRGGPRPGAGRPKGEPTIRVTVPVKVWKMFKKWLTENTKGK